MPAPPGSREHTMLKPGEGRPVPDKYKHLLRKPGDPIPTNLGGPAPPIGGWVTPMKPPPGSPGGPPGPPSPTKTILGPMASSGAYGTGKPSTLEMQGRQLLVLNVISATLRSIKQDTSKGRAGGGGGGGGGAGGGDQSILGGLARFISMMQGARQLGGATGSGNIMGSLQGGVSLAQSFAGRGKKKGKGGGGEEEGFDQYKNNTWNESFSGQHANRGGPKAPTGASKPGGLTGAAKPGGLPAAGGGAGGGAAGVAGKAAGAAGSAGGGGGAAMAGRLLPMLANPVGLAVAAAAAVIVGTVALGLAIKGAADELIEFNKKFAAVHSGMAQMYAEREMREMFRDQKKAEALVGPTGRLIEEEQKFKDETMPMELMWEELKTGILTDFYATFTVIAGGVQGILEMLGVEFKKIPDANILSSFGGMANAMADAHNDRMAEAMPKNGRRP